MLRELNLRFPDAEHVEVRLGDVESGRLPFRNPIPARAFRDLRWYVETYGAHSLGDPDDEEAAEIAGKLKVWGKALFDAVFTEHAARRIFDRFQDAEGAARLLTVTAEHPAILALPWELLHETGEGDVFLFLENPRISIRRRIAGATLGRQPFKVKPKKRLHLLFVVSRPADTTFLDPRADPGAVMDALDASAPGRVSWEFLRPPTLDALIERLDDKSLPPVDVLHFDGHGVFDIEGGLPGRFVARHAARSPAASALLRAGAGEGEHAPNTGYLLFETKDGQLDFVSAEKLGRNLHRHKVALVVLSACQSAKVEEADDSERPMGSVAARLTATGIPSVLAMTHSVLVPTTRALFGAMYKELARSKGLGESLDNARQHLFNHPEKYEVQRGPVRESLRLYDWWLPALYQSGEDVALLAAKAPTPTPLPARRSNLDPSPEAGFFGRRRELWRIERGFAAEARRITLTGFGGQGKTALAQEAGRWLLRTGQFSAAVFVGYARAQGRDAVAVAVATLGTVLGESLIDAEAARAVLARVPTLVILDNLEILAPEPLAELLAAAVGWSEAGGSRVLCTTRRPDFGHPAYRVEGTLVHQRIPLDGLGSRQAPDDALEWVGQLARLPPPPAARAPTREERIDLFDRVRFHPLSIRVLAQQLKTRRAAELGDRLEQLLAASATSPVNEDTPAGLLASIELSLDRLDEAARKLLPRLGVFQGGAMENMALEITEIPEAEWSSLRSQLEAAALVEAESLEDVISPFLRFHPTLAPLLWARLGTEEQAGLSAAHRQQYHGLASYLYNEDSRTPIQARAIARRELPNLLHAVYGALAAGEPEAPDFANSVNLFLGYFGLKREADALLVKAQTETSAAGSQAWYLAQSNRGEQLLAAGQVAAAAQIFQVILENLPEEPSYERAFILTRLGRCFLSRGSPDLACDQAQRAIAMLELLEVHDEVRRLQGSSLIDMANALTEQGLYKEARQVYEDGLEITKELNDLRNQGVALFQLGSLAIRENNLAEAEERNRAAGALFHQLGEPASEAIIGHQLGRVFEEARQWDEAECAYREAARIREEQGDLAGAARTWNQLANVSSLAGKPEAAERWYRKAIDGSRKMGNLLTAARALNNLADLLQDETDRVPEARQLAGEALAIKRTLDPGASEIWTTYTILADIAEKEAAGVDFVLQAKLLAEAREHRRLAREAKRRFAGTRHELRRRADLIFATIAAVAGNAQAKTALDQYQAAMRQGAQGWIALADALSRVLAGERDEDALTQDLKLNQSMILETILRGLEDPSTLQDLLPTEEPEAEQEA